ncbi:MAG: hypothetical protein JSS20_05725 [Proteobacteria bacterium]|nr:hypothetical protein [Pseudomonadota bacterium]
MDQLDQQSLEKRVEELERQMAELRHHSDARSRHPLETFGTVPDDGVTRDAERLGSAYRKRQKKC